MIGGAMASNRPLLSRNPGGSVIVSASGVFTWDGATWQMTEGTEGFTHALFDAYGNIWGTTNTHGGHTRPSSLFRVGQ